MHRNLSTKLRNQSLYKYLKDKCTISNTHNNKEFGVITKLFMSLCFPLLLPIFL